jgi:hypothetical protein
MKNKDRVLTSVKLDPELFEAFRMECIRKKFSFQKLADRAIHLYLTDEEFQRKIHNHNNLNLES